MREQQHEASGAGNTGRPQDSHPGPSVPPPTAERPATTSARSRSRELKMIDRLNKEKLQSMKMLGLVPDQQAGPQADL